AKHERAERALDEQDERDGDKRAHREPPSVYRAHRHNERDGGEEVDEPAGILAGSRPVPATWDEALVQSVRHEDDGQAKRDAPDEPGSPCRDRRTSWGTCPRGGLVRG